MSSEINGRINSGNTEFNPFTKRPYDLNIKYYELSDRINNTIIKYLSFEKVILLRMALGNGYVGDTLHSQLDNFNTLRKKDWKSVFSELHQRMGKEYPEEFLERAILESAFCKERFGSLDQVVEEVNFYKTLDNAQLAKRWDEANSTLVLWKTLNDLIDLPEMSLEQYKTPKERIDKASEFSTWVQEHQEELSHIRSLNLAQNSDICCIPPEIEMLTNLRALDLRGTRIETLPDTISTLPLTEVALPEGVTMKTDRLILFSVGTTNYYWSPAT